MTYTLHCGDCLDILPTLPSGSIDAIIADPPYGTTACKWDEVIPLGQLWPELKRVIKPNGAIVLFCGQPFTSVLVASNIRQFKYCWTWDKRRGRGHLVSKFRPMQQTEDIAVFGQRAIQYYPEMKPKDKPRFDREGTRTSIMGGQISEGYAGKWNTHSHPTTLLSFSWSNVHSFHPTEKPIDLVRYLVRTYTTVGQTVLDFCMGSGTTGAAALMEGRKFVGIEKDSHYFTVAKDRIEQVQPALMEAAD